MYAVYVVGKEYFSKKNTTEISNEKYTKSNMIVTLTPEPLNNSTQL